MPLAAATPDGDRGKLAALAAGDEPVATRARIIQASLVGMSNTAIAAELGVLRKTVALWRTRYTRHGVAGLADEQGRGRRRSPELAEHVILAVLTSAPPSEEADLAADPRPDEVSSAGWTAPELARAIGVHPRTVARVWNDVGLTPRRAGAIRPGVDPVHHGRARTLAGWHVAADHRGMALWVDGSTPRRWPDPATAAQLGRTWEATTAVITATDQAATAVAFSSEGAEALTAHIEQMLSDVPAGVRLWLLVDRPRVELDRATLRLLSEIPELEVKHAPTPAAWRALAQRIVTATVADQLRRGTDLSHQLQRCHAHLLFQAHQPHGRPPVIAWRSDNADRRGGLAAFQRRAPRRRLVPAPPDPATAWASLVRRHHDHPHYEFPARPAVALQHLHRHAPDLGLTVEDVRDALVLLQAQWLHLDRIERELFHAARRALMTAADLTDVLDVGEQGVRDREAGLRHVGPRGSRVRVRARHALERRLPGQDSPLGLDVEDGAPAITEYTAEEIGEHLHARWVRVHGDDGDGQRELPGPSEVLEIVEHVVHRQRRGGPGMPLRVRVGEIRAGFWMLSLLRARFRPDWLAWVRHGRDRGVTWTELGAPSGRTGGAIENYVRCVTAWADVDSPASTPGTTGTSTAVDPEEAADGIAEVLADLLSVEHRALLRSDSDLRASVAAIDDVLDDEDDDHPRATAAIWLSVLITELRYHELIEQESGLAAATERAARWLTDYRRRTAEAESIAPR